MSRHEFVTDKHRIVVGWDPPLQTYFAQVWRKRSGLHPVLWVGAGPPSLTLKQLETALKPFCEISVELRAALEQDEAND